MGLLIDSSVLVGLERRGLHPSRLVEDDGEPLVISAVTLSELLYGLYRAQTPAQRTRRQAFIDAVLAAFAVIPFDQMIAQVHARTWAELAASGLTIGAHDMMIAATALAQEYAVVTENVREFGRIPGLDVRQPAWQ